MPARTVVRTLYAASVVSATTVKMSIFPASKQRQGDPERTQIPMIAAHSASPQGIQVAAPDALLTFKEAMLYLRISRSTLYRLMRSGSLAGHKVGCTWRFYRDDLQVCVRTISAPLALQAKSSADSRDQVHGLVAMSG